MIGGRQSPPTRWMEFLPDLFAPNMSCWSAAWMRWLTFLGVVGIDSQSAADGEAAFTAWAEAGEILG